MATIEVTTQAQLDAALDDAKPYDIIAIRGKGSFSLGRRPKNDSASVRASGSASVTASGSASVRAYGSASVTAYGSASVTAYDSASVTASGSASVTASKYVSVHTQEGQGKPTVEGGVLIHVPAIRTVADWCEVHGVTVEDGYATVYKAVDDDFGTDYSRAASILYTPGTDKLTAPDWDPIPQCGNGLHVAPTPGHALRYNEGATRFVSLRVKLREVRKPRLDDDHDKVKAKAVYGPIVEVDVHGRAVA
jgi:hypothetical protein